TMNSSTLFIFSSLFATLTVSGEPEIANDTPRCHIAPAGSLQHRSPEPLRDHRRASQFDSRGYTDDLQWINDDGFAAFSVLCRCVVLFRIFVRFNDFLAGHFVDPSC